jgi:hypothetical protein
VAYPASSSSTGINLHRVNLCSLRFEKQSADSGRQRVSAREIWREKSFLVRKRLYEVIQRK